MMNWKKFLITTGLFGMAFITIGCGDDHDPRLSDADVANIKCLNTPGCTVQGQGGSANTKTETASKTVTVTQTTTVNN